MGAKFSNNASATLASSISNVAVSIAVTTGQGALFPALVASEYFYATLMDSSNNLEIIKVTGRATDTLTVVRGQDGTTARNYSAGSRLELRIPAAALQNFAQIDTANTFTQPQTLPGAPTANNHAATKKYVDDTASATVAGQIGSTIQAYDADTAKTDVAQSWTAAQRVPLTTDNDGSFNIGAGGKQTFKCTPTGNVTLTFANQVDGANGSVVVINGSNYVFSAHANTTISTAALARLSTTGTYRIDFLSDGTKAYCTVSENLTA